MSASAVSMRAAVVQSPQHCSVTASSHQFEPQAWLKERPHTYCPAGHCVVVSPGQGARPSAVPAVGPDPHAFELTVRSPSTRTTPVEGFKFRSEAEEPTL